MSASDLCTLNDVLAFLLLKDKSDDVTNDLIESLITSKTAAITLYIGYNQILADDYTEILNGDGMDRIYTNNVPINTITEVNLDSNRDFGTDTTVGSDDYVISGMKDYILLKDKVTYNGSQNIKVIYNAGFTTIPDDLKQVCVEEVSRSHNEKLNIGISSRTDGKGGVTRVEKGFMKQSYDVMDRYIRRVLI